ncbi:MAG: O-methyltransferase [Bacillota bacterium]
MIKTELNSLFSEKKMVEAEFVELEKLCRNDNIPIIDRDAADFLKIQLQLLKPKNILEIGTAYGFSALIMAKYTPASSRITTIEVDEQRAAEARKFLEKYGFDDKVSIKIGDALDILQYLRQSFDFIFLDAAKGQYLYLFDYIFDLLKPGGLLISDNVLYKSEVLSDDKVRHKIRTIVTNLKKYLKIIMNHPELDSTIIAAGDGIALSRRKLEDEKS